MSNVSGFWLARQCISRHAISLIPSDDKQSTYQAAQAVFEFRSSVCEIFPCASRIVRLFSYFGVWLWLVVHGTPFLTDMFGCVDGTKMMCTIYWTLDIGASLSTAVFVNGKLVTERRVIIRQCEAQMSGWSSACRSQTMHRVYASESYYNLQAFICQLSEFVLFFSLLSHLVFLHLLGCFP